MSSRLGRIACLTGGLFAISLAIAQAGRVPKPIRVQETVRAGRIDQWTMRFTGGELASISVAPNDGVSDLDLMVYDVNNNQIGAATAELRPNVAWTPVATAPFKIQVLNNESAPVAYTLSTN
jgi:hypothetical protein